MMLLAFPGVGNVGKVALESLWNLNPTQVIARLHPSGLPPLAKLDEDGLLSPPHLTLSKMETAGGSHPVSYTHLTLPTKA